MFAESGFQITDFYAVNKQFPMMRMPEIKNPMTISSQTEMIYLNIATYIVKVIPL